MDIEEVCNMPEVRAVTDEHAKVLSNMIRSIESSLLKYLDCEPDIQIVLCPECSSEITLGELDARIPTVEGMISHMASDGTETLSDASQVIPLVLAKYQDTLIRTIRTQSTNERAQQVAEKIRVLQDTTRKLARISKSMQELKSRWVDGEPNIELLTSTLVAIDNVIRGE